MRGLIAVIVGAALLVGAGYWLRSSDDSTKPTETAADEPIDSPTNLPARTSPNEVPASAESAAPEISIEGKGDPGVFRPGTPPELLADIAAFQGMRDPQAAAARARIVARGPGQMPAVMAALDDVVTNGGTLAQQNHLMAVAAQLGNPSHADDLIAIAVRISPDNLMSGSIYDVLDIIGTPQKADQFALDIIADSGSDSMQLASALARYWYTTSDATARQALQHRSKPSLQIRALVYRLAINGGIEDTIRKELEDEVSALQFGEPGNITALNALAAIESPDKFAERIDGLRLRPDLRRAAGMMSEFLWASDAEKIELLPRMLSSDVGEVLSTATAHIIEQGRVDLLREYGLANFGPEQAAASRALLVSPRTRKVAGRLGYSIVAVGDSIQIEPSAR